MQFGYATDVFEQQSLALNNYIYNMEKRTIIVCEVQATYMQIIQHLVPVVRKVDSAIHRIVIFFNSCKQALKTAALGY